MLIQIAGGVVAFLYRDEAVEYMKTGLTKSLQAYGGSSSEEAAFTTAVDLAQV